MSGGSENFDAPWGRALKLISAFSTVLILGVAAIAFDFQRVPPVARILAAALPPAILIPCLLFTVRGYTLRPDALLVRRLLWSTEIPLAGLRSAHEQPHAMRGALRVFGNGGLYSFTGLYWKKGFGSFRAFVTDLNRCVVLRLPQRTIVVSPDDPQRFVRQASAR